MLRRTPVQRGRQGFGILEAGFQGIAVVLLTCIIQPDSKALGPAKHSPYIPRYGKNSRPLPHAFVMSM